MCTNQGIIDWTGTETQQISSRMFVIEKVLKSFFTSTLNKIAASVRCVSSTPVVLNVKFSISCGRQKEDDEKRRNPKKVTFSRGGTLTLNFCSNLLYISMICESQ